MEQLHYKSDFSIALTDREEYPWLRLDGDFEINVTSELPDEATKRVTAKRASGTLTGCEMRGGAVYIAIPAGTLDPGEVWVEIAADIPDADTGATRHISESWQIGIELTATGPAGGATVVTMEVLEAKITAALGEVIDKYGISTAATAWDERIAAIDNALAEGAGVASDQSATIAELNSTISGLNTTVSDLNGTISDLNDTIGEKDTEIAGLNATISGYDTTIAEKDAAIAEKDGTITELNTTIEGLNATIDGFDETLAAKDAEIEECGKYKIVMEQINSASGLFLNNYDIAELWFYMPKNAGVTSMFQGCANLRKVSGLLGKNLSWMFQSWTGQSMDISEIDFSTVTNMGCMFYQATVLKSVDLAGLDFPVCTDISQLCYGCLSLTSFTLGGASFPKLTNISSIFYNCTKLEEVDLSGDTFPTVTYIGSMFYGCTSLKKVTCEEDSFPLASSATQIFRNCTALQYVYGSIHVDNVTGSSYGNTEFVGCTSLLRLHLKGIGTASATTQLYLNALTSWGTGGDDNLKSLVDTLVNDSFDRLSAGYSECTLRLKQTQVDLLSDDEKAAITAKGYTISAS